MFGDQRGGVFGVGGQRNAQRGVGDGQLGEAPAVAGGLDHEPLVVAADLRRPEAPAVVAEQALAGLGRVDVLVNNAAAAVRLSIADTGSAVIDEMLAVNVRAPLLLIAALVPAMVEHGGGSIVNLSSVSALLGTPRRAAYAASKGALDAAIRVNSVAPGVVDTALWAKNKAIPGVVETIEAQTPLRRWARPEDIADVIVFLASDSARFVTGETISVDGGMARTLDLYGGSV